MIALLDSDILAYRCSASAENDPPEIACVRLDEFVRRILYETNASSYIGYLTGKDNFRYTIYPEYKAHRKDKPKPKHLELVKERLIKEWGCKVTDGIEADDALAIDLTEEGDNAILCSIDKDFLQVAGKHYNFVKQTTTTVSPLDGLKSFYTQLITGDSTDNIPAFDGKFRNTVPKFVQKLLDPIQEMTNELEMYKYCQDIWNDNTLMHRNAHCLYLLRKENEHWQPPTTTENGQPDECEDSLSLHYETPQEDGLLSTKP